MESRTREITEEEKIVEAIFAELDQHNLSSLPPDEKIAAKQSIAKGLAHQTKTLSHHLALTILMRATRHKLFSDEKSHQIIMKAYHHEKFHRSPINTGAKTLEFILAYRVDHEQEVEEFLLDPERVTSWINQATGLEISRFFDHFFTAAPLSKSKYYKHVFSIAEREYEQNIFGKSFILLCLIFPHPLKPETISYCKQAIINLHVSDQSKYKRIIQMAAVRVNPNIKTITNANQSFVNLNKLKMNYFDFTQLQMAGSKLNETDLTRAIFNSADMSSAHFKLATLNFSQFKNACLIKTNFQNARLCHSDLTNADLCGADLTDADLTHANLHRANFKNAILTNTRFNDVTFFNDATLTTVGAFKTELNYLSQMLQQHAFRSTLIAAIMNDILRRIYSKSISDLLLISILEAAYDHPLFAQHDEHHFLKSASNVINSSLQSASTVISSTVFGWFYRPVETKKPTALQYAEDIPLYETKAQTRLREELRRLKGPPVTPTKPAPPGMKPTTPSPAL